MDSETTTYLYVLLYAMAFVIGGLVHLANRGFKAMAELRDDTKGVLFIETSKTEVSGNQPFLRQSTTPY